MELFNRGNSAVNLSGWSVQYADSMSGNWQVISLSGTLDPGRYYLIGGATGSNGAALPTPDLSSTVALAAAGKVALADHTTALIGAVPEEYDLADLVGYGFADWYEGLDGQAPLSDATAAALRLGHGNYDMNSNQWDFTADEPNPRNTASPVANRAPAVSSPDELGTALNAAVTFSTSNGNAITVADPDAGTADLEISLSAEAGTLTLAGTTGLTFTAGDGTADESMTFTGSLTSINAALNGLTYTPETGYRGAGWVTLWADDLGNTGAGGSLIDYGSAFLVIDGPVVALGDEIETLEDEPIDIHVRENDVWLGSAATSISIVTGPSNGTAVVDDNDTPSDPSDDFIVYTPDDEYFGSDSFTYELDDGSNVDTATVSLTVEQVNDAHIDNTGEPHMYAEEGELIDVTFQTPDATEDIEWSAVGLPDGLTLVPDPLDTHLIGIEGRPEYYDAQENAGEWAVTLTATSDSGDIFDLEFTWHVADVNRIPWIDDQAHQEGQSASTDYYADDNINPFSEWVYTFSGLPVGMSSPNDPIPIGVAGNYNVTITFTAGDATDTRTYNWLIVTAADPIPMGQTPAPGVAAFALNDSFVHYDDVGLVGKGTPVTVKYFLTELDYQNFGNNNLGPVKLQVMAGDAGLTTDPNDPIGSSSITIDPTVGGTTWAQASAYLVGHVPSTAVDDIVVAAFRRINNVWTQMQGEGKKNDLIVKIGTGLDDNNKPKHQWDGIVDAKTTPGTMFMQGKYRIPPRKWDATSLWVTKDGPIGDDQVVKFLYLVAPRFARPLTPNLEGQSHDNGRVALSKKSNPGGDYERKLKLVEDDFSAPAHTGEKTATIWIRGQIDVKNKEDAESGKEPAYQTKAGKGGKLWLGVFASPDDSKIETLGKEYAWTQGFSVAAIPTKAIERKLTDNPARITPGYVGMRVVYGFESDSGNTADLDEVYASEAVRLVSSQMKPPPKVKPYFYLDVPISKLVWKKGESGPHAALDEHARPKESLKIPDVTKYEQLIVFKDLRTGAQDVPIKNSGFKFTYEVKKDTDGAMKLFITKEPATVYGDFMLYDRPAQQGGQPVPRGPYFFSADPGENSPAGAITGAYGITGEK